MVNDSQSRIKILHLCVFSIQLSYYYRTACVVNASAVYIEENTTTSTATTTTTTVCVRYFLLEKYRSNARHIGESTSSTIYSKILGFSLRFQFHFNISNIACALFIGFSILSFMLQWLLEIDTRIQG